MALMIMAPRSLSPFLGKNCWGSLLFGFLLEEASLSQFCVFEMVLCMHKKLFWILMAHLYHLPRVVGGLERFMMQVWWGIGSISLKYSTTAMFFLMF